MQTNFISEAIELRDKLMAAADAVSQLINHRSASGEHLTLQDLHGVSEHSRGAMQLWSKLLTSEAPAKQPAAPVPPEAAQPPAQ